jgi:hypothetical protein
LHTREGTVLNDSGAIILEPGIYAMTTRSFQRLTDLGDFGLARLQPNAVVSAAAQLSPLPQRTWHQLTEAQQDALHKVYHAFEYNDGEPGFVFTVAARRPDFYDMGQSESDAYTDQLEQALRELAEWDLAYELADQWSPTAAGAHVLGTPWKWPQLSREHAVLLSALDDGTADVTALIACVQETMPSRSSHEARMAIHDLEGWGLLIREEDSGSGQLNWSLSEHGRLLLDTRPEPAV